MSAPLALLALLALAGGLAAFLAGERLGRWRHERSRRAAETEAAVAQRNAREISGRIRQHSEAAPVLREAVVAVGEALHLDRVLVQMVAPHDGRHRTELLAATRQWWAPHRSALGPDAETGGRLDPETAAALGTGRSVVVEDCRRPTPYGQEPDGAGAALLAATGARSLVLTPVMSGDELLGVLTSVSEAARTFTGPDVQLLESVAWSLGRALQNSQLEEQQLALLEQLRELDRSKSEFVSSVSHELRTPLTSIAGYLEMLRDGDAGPLTGDQLDMLDIVGRNTTRLQTLIEDLLTLGRIESGALPLAEQPVSVAALLGQVRTALAPLAQSAGLELEVAPVPTDAVVIGDPAKLEQVLVNLLSNAVKFTPAGGRVQVRTLVDRAAARGLGEVAVAVSDTGIGIPQEEQGELFARFFRASNATERATQGVGLGLSIAEGIVAAHHGSVEVESREGVGTTVTVRLPWQPARGEQAGPPARL